jgi:DNA-binding CsgD family transcriptional regulator
VLRDIVDGKLSTIDGFVSNGRCFTLARPNDPCLGDPRALTAQEKKVLLHTARGERRKLVANHVGISRSGVSRVLGSGMRKLGVRSQSELAMKVRCLERYGLLDPQ